MLRSPGRPLDAATRAAFEPRFGHNFRRVRVHTGARAAESARAVRALAYTVGRDVVFAEGRYSPGTAAGMKLLAHEHTHVVQQDGGATGVRDPPGARPAVPEVQRAGPQLQLLGAPTKIPPGLSCTPATDSPQANTEVVLFPNRGTKLTLADRALIENVVRNWRAMGANQPVRVDGHASQPADDALNWRLSCERAEAMAAELRAPSSGAVAGIPGSFITLFMQGETDEFGAEGDNRRANISVPQPVPPPPPPPPTPSTTTPTDDTCRRARQVECVRRLGGCPNTRPAGIPEPEEIERYNVECREETGYAGPSVTPTAEECAASEVHPTQEECRTRDFVCGPNISQPLAAMLADVRSTYAGWRAAGTSRKACDQITRVPIPFATSGFIMAWDIHDLFLPETGWLCDLPYHGPCGRPPDTGCDDEDSTLCGNSVEVDRKCFLAGTVNYRCSGRSAGCATTSSACWTRPLWKD